MNWEIVLLAMIVGLLWLIESHLRHLRNWTAKCFEHFAAPEMLKKEIERQRAVCQLEELVSTFEVAQKEKKQNP